MNILFWHGLLHISSMEWELVEHFSVSVSKSLKILPSQSEKLVFLHHLTTHLFVKPNSINIPIQHNPVYPSVIPFYCFLCHCTKQHFPKSHSPVTLPHVQVLHVKPCFSQKSRIVWEKHHKPYHTNIVHALERVALGVLIGEPQIHEFSDGFEERVGVKGWNGEGGGRSF